MNDRLRQSLVVATGVYLALLPTSALTFWRSLGFGIAALCALLLVARSARGIGPRLPSPGRAVTFTIAAWALWSTATLAWSVHPAVTIDELRREIAWTLLAVVPFYVAAAESDGYRRLLVVALGAFAVAAVAALGLALTTGVWDAGRWHAGAGAYSTYVVLVAPLLLTTLAPPPTGFASGWRSRVTGIALLVLLLATARLTENRMVWIALAVVFATASALGALRWRETLARAPLRWLAPLVALLLALGALFIDVARERAVLHFPPHTSVRETLERDPRIALWDYTAARIAERPLAGYGFGKRILEDELRAGLHDPLLAHAHNVFMSQWLQTGAVGLAAFLAMLVALAWRYAGFLRSRDDTLAFVGLVGLSMLAGFVVKNLTDDFFIRSNAKEFWAFSAMLLAFGASLEKARADRANEPAGSDLVTRGAPPRVT